MRHVKIRKFEEKDVPNKVKWINDDRNNQFLHYDVPLSLENTYRWYEKIKNDPSRYDAVIEFDGMPVGVIGLLSIQNGKAEYYITLGVSECRGKGIAKEATKQILQYGFENLELVQIYLYTEVQNTVAQRLFEKCGFKRRSLLKGSAMNRGKPVDRFYYQMLREDFMANRNNIVTVGGVLCSSCFSEFIPVNGMRWAA